MITHKHILLDAIYTLQGSEQTARAATGPSSSDGPGSRFTGTPGLTESWVYCPELPLC